jgi:transcriptional regulator with XRE-family HTH domain
MTGPELRSRRLRLGRSREQVAQAVGVPVETLTDWEAGASPIRCPVAIEVVLRDGESERDRWNPVTEARE